MLQCENRLQKDHLNVNLCLFFMPQLQHDIQTRENTIANDPLFWLCLRFSLATTRAMTMATMMRAMMRAMMMATMMAVMMAMMTDAHPSHPLAAINYQNIQWQRKELEPGLAVSVTPTKLQRSGEWVLVWWEGVTNPSPADWIAVYSPAFPSNYSAVSPIKYQVL